MTPCFDNGFTRLYRSDAREIPLADRSVHCVVTSPPYYGLRVYEGATDGVLGLEPTIEEYIAALLEVFAEVWRVLRDDGVFWLNLGDSYSASSGERGSRGTREGDPKYGGREGRLHGPNRRGSPGMRDGDRLGIPERVVLALQSDGWLWRDTVIWAKPAPMPESVQGVRWERCRVKVRGNLNTGGGKQANHPDRRKVGINDRTHPERTPKAGLNGDRRGPDSSDRWYGRGQEAYRLGSSPGKPQQDHDGRDFLPSAQWEDCSGCAKCEPNGGYVLRRGSWRCTSSHEYIYMLTKGMGYYADGEAVKTPLRDESLKRVRQNDGRPIWNPDRQRDSTQMPQTLEIGRMALATGANCRSVWSDIRPEPYHGEHFAVFPSDLPRLCIQASTSEAGVCPECGSQWARVVEKKPSTTNVRVREAEAGRRTEKSYFDRSATDQEIEAYGAEIEGVSETTAWRSTCRCEASNAVPATVLDPFVGSGTTCLAAQSLGRRSIGVDLSESYLAQAMERLTAIALPMAISAPRGH